MRICWAAVVAAWHMQHQNNGLAWQAMVEVQRAGGEARRERAPAVAAAAAARPGVECQPNGSAPLLRDEKARREWLELELNICCQVCPDQDRDRWLTTDRLF